MNTFNFPDSKNPETAIDFLKSFQEATAQNACEMYEWWHFHIQWWIWLVSVYSKALSYTASRSTDFENTRVLNFAKNCTDFVVFLKATQILSIFGTKALERYTEILRFFKVSNITSRYTVFELHWLVLTQNPGISRPYCNFKGGIQHPR